MNGPEILIPITFFLSTAAAVFGLRYMVNKERMAMIEKGMDIGATKAQPQPYKNLKWGLLLIGLGLGLFIAYLLDYWVFNSTNEELNEKVGFIYFSLMAIFGGLGLFISYLIEKKETLI